MREWRGTSLEEENLAASIDREARIGLYRVPLTIKLKGGKGASREGVMEA